jgi:hypothetical protein
VRRGALSGSVDGLGGENGFVLQIEGRSQEPEARSQAGANWVRFANLGKGARSQKLGGRELGSFCKILSG